MSSLRHDIRFEGFTGDIAMDRDGWKSKIHATDPTNEIKVCDSCCNELIQSQHHTACNLKSA